ncbi:hypothetical protein TcasGA2_TC013373 [Tribolium castaneum]|uniref:Uncharacterized protein n=1 Tax=Tribolium castaneum TaxID=7070 RepID=D6WLX8_TRICA|nr:hypothetical protein TcasGA2_TC013373 [Tribolium castaneum]
MRRYLVVGGQGPIVHVLNGDYPEADLRRMSVPGLERLVMKLVQCTRGRAAKPQWWPSGLVLTHPLDLGLRSEHELKSALKSLIVGCCRFVRGQEQDSPQHKFLRYFRLAAATPKKPAAAPLPPGAKLAVCTHIPFSSDVGRLMAAREQHSMSEELKLRRLERSEWYTNKEGPKPGEVEYEVGGYKEPEYSHKYKFPKRQFHHKRRSLHDAEFLARFCTPLSVVVERLNLDKVDVKRKRELVVTLRYHEKVKCDLKRIVRTSPRLRNV